MADSVTLRSPDGKEITRSKTAIPFYTNQGYVVLDSAGRVNSKATSVAATNSKGDG